jgi:hypothetical protein|tara:strand:+ start:148 stop:360 length:213 start_codon:yes stop_codon:yes gene_type:complete
MKLEIGDLVSVRYLAAKLEELGPDQKMFLGCIIEVSDSPGPHTMDKMWCFETESVHILNPHRDKIKVLNR